MRKAVRRRSGFALAAIAAAALTACGPAVHDTVVAGQDGTWDGPYDDVSVAAREAADSGRPVELTELRSAQARTFIRPDGRTLIERTDAAGKTTREVVNTSPIVLPDQRQDPQKCSGGDGPKATSLTPTFSVTVADVDHRVNRSRVRVYFELRPVGGPQITGGWSEWTEPYTRASWAVPAGLLHEDGEYLWRARADDGVTTSAWPSWEWHYFGIDLAAEPEGSCGGDDIGLGYPASEFALLALDELAKAQPARYQGYGGGNMGIGLYAVRQAGMTDDQIVAAALADGRRAILASTASGVTDELKRRAAGALEIEIVGFTLVEVDEAYEDLMARVARKDPTLPTLADVSSVSDSEHGWYSHIDVVAREMTDAQQEDLKARYGDRIVLERIPADAPWTEFESFRAMDDINARRMKNDSSLPEILMVFVPVWDKGAYVKVLDLSDTRAKALQAEYGERIRVDDGSKPPMYGAPDDAW
jgi:hypothetical protein